MAVGLDHFQSWLICVDDGKCQVPLVSAVRLHWSPVRRGESPRCTGPGAPGRKTENAYLKTNPAHWWWANRQQEEGIVIVLGQGGVAVAQVFNFVHGAGNQKSGFAKRKLQQVFCKIEHRAEAEYGFRKKRFGFR